MGMIKIKASKNIKKQQSKIKKIFYIRSFDVDGELITVHIEERIFTRQLDLEIGQH